MGKVFLEKHKEIIELSEVGIDRISELVTDSLTKLQVEYKDIIRLRLAFEDILIVWKTRLGDNISKCTFSCGERFGRVYITVGVPGNKMDPSESGDDDSEEILYSALLAQAGISPNYSYINGENRLTLNPAKPKQVSLLKKQIITMVSAAVLGVLCLFVPEGIRLAVAEAVDLIFSAFIGVLTALAGPLIFLSVCVGIINIGDVSVLSRIGKTVIFRFLSRLFIVVLILALLISWTFEGGSAVAGSESAGIVMQILTMIFNIIPGNIIAPFAEGNTLQIIFIAVCLGTAVIVLGDKVSAARTVIVQSNSLVQTLMEFLGRFICVLIFVSVFSIVISGEVSELGNVAKGCIICIAANLIIPFMYAVIVSIRLKVPYSLLIKKIIPVYIVALSTASSSAALSLMLENCEKKMGISPRLVKFAVPIGQVVFKVGSVIAFFTIALTLGDYYDLAITPSWIVIIMISVVLLASATPPVMGGGLVVYAVLFAQAGIPEAAISIAVAWEILVDFFSTGCSVFCLQVEMLMTANKLNMLDRDVLTRQDNGVKAPNV